MVVARDDWCYRPRMLGRDMQRFWDDRARENALYFVDNNLDYDQPDRGAFWSRGEGVLDQMLDTVGLTIASSAEVLDIGCGVGRLTAALARRSRLVYGLDVSSEMLALARSYNAELPNVEWLQGDGHGLDNLADGSVDGCFSHVVFQHVPEPEITLGYVREIGRVLRPGGWALFQVSTDPRVHRPQQERRTRLRGLLRADRRYRQERAWWGSAVEVPALRAAATEGGLVIERLVGEGSQYTTVLARRRSG